MAASQSYRLRAARGEDAERVQRLLQLSKLPLDGLDEQFGDNYAVAVDGADLVGVEGIELYGEDGLLRSAAVDASRRGQGIGDALTRDRIAWARTRGLRAVYLLTTTAQNYFPRFGFVAASRDDAPDAIKRSREFADACPASAHFMKLTLRETGDQ